MPGVYQLEPGAALTPAGDLVVVFTSGGRIFEPSHLGVARVPAGGEPVIDRPLPTGKRNHFNAWVAAGRDGAVHAVWLGHDGGGVDLDAEIGYARSRDGGATWTEPVAIHAPEDCPPGTRFCLDKPMIAVGPVPGAPAREAVRAFYSADAAGGLRMRSSLDGGATWSPPVTAAEGTYADVAIDSAGRVHVAVSLSDPSGAGAWGSTENQVALAVSRDGKRFARPVPVSAPGESIPFFFVNPTIAIDDARGWIHIAYVAGTPDGRWDIRLASSRDGGRSWRRRAVNDDPTCANHSVPNLALDPASGALHLTWYENRGGAGHLAYTTCVPGGACAPSVRASERHGCLRAGPPLVQVARWLRGAAGRPEAARPALGLDPHGPGGRARDRPPAPRHAAVCPRIGSAVGRPGTTASSPSRAHSQDLGDGSRSPTCVPCSRRAPPRREVTIATPGPPAPPAKSAHPRPHVGAALLGPPSRQFGDVLAARITEPAAQSRTPWRSASWRRWLRLMPTARAARVRLPPNISMSLRT